MKYLHVIILLILFTFLFTNCDKDDDDLVLSCTPEYILNSSFEDSEPGLSTIPEGWDNCGDTLQSPTDLFQNDLENQFMVTNIAEEGQQYVGMVVRPNGTKECLFQTLRTPLNPGDYQIFISYAKPINYTSIAEVNSEYIILDFNEPIALEIIGVNNNNEEQVLLTTPPNESTDWTEPSFNINITETINEIKLQPTYIGSDFYAGGILIDYFRIGEN